MSRLCVKERTIWVLYENPPTACRSECGGSQARIVIVPPRFGASACPSPGRGPRRAPPPPPAYGTPISLEQAKKVMAGAEAEAKKNSWNVAIAIHDSGGNLVMLQRLDGTQFGSTEVAKDKAYSAVAFRRPTKAFQDAIEQGGSNLRPLKLSGASPLEGGIPIVVDGKLIGSIGVSGVTSQ